MTYKDTLQKVDTVKALTLLELTAEQNGAYVKFKCQDCAEGMAPMKAYGDKKNLYYCPKCKASGHIISLVQKVKLLDWKEATEFLNQAISDKVEKITDELSLNYDLTYSEFLKGKGITEDTAKKMEIGTPKGRTMLAGCIAFMVKDDTGKKIAYYGIKMKDGKTVFHKSFSPELYLYGYSDIAKDKPVYLTTDIFKCVQLIGEGKQAVCNFGLPYISPNQFELLKGLDHIIFKVENPREFAMQMIDHKGYYYFE